MSNYVPVLCGAMMKTHQYQKDNQKKLEEKHKQELIEAENRRHQKALNAINGVSNTTDDELMPKIDWIFEISGGLIETTDRTKPLNELLNYKLERFIKKCEKICFRYFKIPELLIKEIEELLKDEIESISYDLIFFNQQEIERIKQKMYSIFSVYGKRYAGYYLSYLEV